jgi:hypothetical protein
MRWEPAEGKPILILEPNDFLASDRAMLDKLSKELAFTDVTPLLAGTVPAAKRDRPSMCDCPAREAGGAVITCSIGITVRAGRR